MDVTNRYQVLEALERNEVDFALVSVLPENLQVEKRTFIDNKLFLFFQKKSRPWYFAS